MPNSNRESGAPAPEKFKPESEKETEKSSHASQALEKESQQWNSSELGRLLEKVRSVCAAEREKFEFTLAELESVTAMSPSEKSQKQEQIEDFKKKSEERFELISKLQKAQHLRSEYSLYSGSLGDWMDLFAGIARVDFRYNPKTSLLKQFKILKKSLPPEMYKDLDARAAELMKKAEAARDDYNNIVRELETSAKVYLAEELDRQGFWADQLPQ